MRSTGDLPKLKGFEVYATGAGAAADARAPSPDAVRQFWIEYFRAAHANLSRANYNGPPASLSLVERRTSDYFESSSIRTCTGGLPTVHPESTGPPPIVTLTGAGFVPSGQTISIVRSSPEEAVTV
jgi:hypothetical protein